MKEKRFGLIGIVCLILCLVCAVGVIFAACSSDNGDDPNGGGDGTDTESGFVIADENGAADIIYDANDALQVVRAVNDLQSDIEAVTGQKPELTTDKSADTAIIVGTADSAIIQEIYNNGKLSELDQIRGKWECYVIKEVEEPVSGVGSAIVVAGSDKRGAVFGMYTISENIGVSPWYWWADVPIRTQSKLTYDYDTVVSSEPDVKYRGIFLNDEMNLTTWAKSFEKGSGSPNSEVYSRFFELLLRLKANTIWPAMHGVSEGFYVHKDEEGKSVNAAVANEYGIVIGTSHCEPCMRNNIADWEPWLRANSGKYGLPDTANFTHSQVTAAYDYSVYPEAVAQYWRESLEANKDYETLINIGMRGVHDEGFQYAGLSDKSFRSRVDLLQSVIDKQIEMIKEIHGEDYEDKVQLVFIPYKEAANYYYGTENGVDYNYSIELPQSTILMWAEDNYGYLRQTADPEEVHPIDEGGQYNNSGVYYHSSYVGVPCVHIWLNIINLSLVYEEMDRAYNTGMNGYWIVNVGDLKPGEYVAEYFLNLAFDVDGYTDDRLDEFMFKNIVRDFGLDDELAQETAELFVEYLQIANGNMADYTGKAEMADVSLVAFGDEAQRIIDRMEEMADRAAEIAAQLDPSCRDAFYELMQYSINGSLYSYQRIYYAQKAAQYKQQGRYKSVQGYLNLALEANENLWGEVDYYNDELANGKWHNLMNPYIGGAYFGIINDEEFEKMVTSISEGFGVDGVGAVMEGQDVYVDDGTLYFSSYSDDMRYIDVFALGDGTYNWTIQADSFLQVEKSGSVSVEDRLFITVDWDNCQPGENPGSIVITDEYDHTYVFNVIAVKQEVELEEGAYIEENGYVSIEAEHYSYLTEGDQNSYWEVIYDLGRESDCLKLYPDSLVSDDSYGLATATYRVYFNSAGTFQGQVYRIPTLNESGSMRFAIGLEASVPQVINGVYSTGVSGWSPNVMRQIDILNFSITVPSAGYHDVILYGIDPGVSIDKIVIDCGAGLPYSYYGAPESYNTISWERTEPADLPDLGEIVMNETLESMNLWFSFGYADVAPGEYIEMPLYNKVYGDDKGFGWATAEGLTDVTREEYNRAPRNQAFTYGSGGNTFKVKVENGQYGVAVVTGDPVSTGMTLNETIRINGTTVADNVTVPAGEIWTYGDVFTVTDGYIEIEFTGSLWAVSAIEIFENVEPEKEGNEGYFVIGGNGGYIQAEEALENSDYAFVEESTTNNKEWMKTAGVSGAAVIVSPETNASNTNTSPFTGARLSYQLYFEQTGTYYVWALAKCLSLDDDSFHILLDGKNYGAMNYGRDVNSFQWLYTRISINVSRTGVHTLDLYSREDGFVLDAIYLTRGASSISGGYSFGDNAPYLPCGTQIRTTNAG